MSINKENYANYYQQGLSRGFDIVDVRQYYVQQGDMLLPDLEQMITTPWTCDGNPVSGYTITNIDVGAERRLGYREIRTHELWIFDPKQGIPVNLDELHPEGYYLHDAQGNLVTVDDAYMSIDEFSVAASYCFHVFMAPEFAECRNYLNSTMGLPPVTAEDYKNYLKHVESQFQNSNMIFTGKIKKLSDLQIAYDSMDGFDEYNK